MKKHLVSLFTLCSSAVAAPYYLPGPQPGALTPYDWQPTTRLEALYAIGTSDTPDTWGFRTGIDLYSSGESPVRHEFCVNLAPQWGDGHEHHVEGRVKQNLFHMPLTVGYDLNLNLFQNVFLFVGGKFGWAFGRYEEEHRRFRNRDSYNGVTYSLGGGIKIQCSERLYAQAGYEFARTNTHRDKDWNQHVFTAGLGWIF